MRKHLLLQYIVSVFLTLALWVPALLFTKAERNISKNIIDLKDSLFWAEADESETIDVSNLNFSKLNNKERSKLTKLINKERGYVWIKADFVVPESLKDKELALHIGNLRMADKIWMNGYFVGGSGFFPPNEFDAGMFNRSYDISGVYVNFYGTNELLIKIWFEGTGIIDGCIYIGDREPTVSHARLLSFFRSRVNLIFVGVLYFSGIFYFLLFIAHKKEKEHIMYSLTNFFTIMFLIPFFYHEVPIASYMNMSYLWFIKIFLVFFAILTIHFATSFMITFLDGYHPKWMLRVRIGICIVSSHFFFAIPTYALLRKLLIPVLVPVAVIQIMFGVNSIIQAIKEKKNDVFILILGFLPVLVSLPIDLIYHIILRNSMMPYFTIWGWQASVVSFLLILAIRYATMSSSLEKLTHNLEFEVEQRTKELQLMNQNLEDEQAAQKRDMDMAVYVQQSFMPKSNKQFIGWDTAVYYKPLSGVSGDMYDYYAAGNWFQGISLFDVSGHGIPAGLVTMLCKNIIYRQFRSGFKKTETLETVMDNINTAVTSAKGNIENYLTGVVARFGAFDSDDVCKVEFCSAGHPAAIMYDTRNKCVVEQQVEKDVPHFGMIGIPGLETCFPSFEFEMAIGDVLVCYTDGLTETEDMAENQYGKERLMQVISECHKLSAQKIIEEIKKSIERFTNGNPMDDDITVIVLKRDNSSDFVEELQEI